MKKKKLFVIDENVARRYIKDCLARKDKKALTTFCNHLIDEGTSPFYVCQLVLDCKVSLSSGNVK